MLWYIISKILGIRIKKTDYGALIKFPFWLSNKNKEIVLDRLRKDYEVKNCKSMKFEIGHRIARLEYNKSGDGLWG